MTRALIFVWTLHVLGESLCYSPLLSSVIKIWCAGHLKEIFPGMLFFCKNISHLSFFKPELVYTVSAQQRSAASAVFVFSFHVNTPSEEADCCIFGQGGGHYITSTTSITCTAIHFIHSDI